MLTLDAPKIAATARNEIPCGFQIIAPGNFHLYRTWLEAAMADVTVRRYLSGTGWHEPLKDAPDSDWSQLLVVSERTLIRFWFDRGPLNEVRTGLWTIGQNKRIASGRALVVMARILRRYSYIRRVASGCKLCNAESMSLHRHVFGEPWGIEPESVWDEVVGGYVGQAHFSIPMSQLLSKFADA